MRTLVVANADFDWHWPFAVDRLVAMLQAVAEVDCVRMAPGSDQTLASVVSDPARVERLLALGVPIQDAELDAFSGLQEAFIGGPYETPGEWDGLLAARGVRRIKQPSEGFWGPSVSEFALALTLAGLRQIPQAHCAIRSSQDEWVRRLEQFSDDPRFTNGTVEGKRVRVVGAGNIASRYASFAHFLGADVAAWDPFAPEPAFHRAGARREWHLDRLVVDAEIFAPLVPLTPSTRGLVTADHVRALPKGCLVVLATRAAIVDMDELRRRVLADELSLAADVFDVEPLPLDDPLLGRHNVVHTPHIAGRTKDANDRWAEMLVEQFREYDPSRVPARAR
jgi:phosphoglycerate dehydrogenase-like enzyme